jgi:hypothetical protein
MSVTLDEVVRDITLAERLVVLEAPAAEPFSCEKWTLSWPEFYRLQHWGIIVPAYPETYTGEVAGPWKLSEFGHVVRDALQRVPE